MTPGFIYDYLDVANWGDILSINNVQCFVSQENLYKGMKVHIPLRIPEIL